jgi:hypothetical protein
LATEIVTHQIPEGFAIWEVATGRKLVEMAKPVDDVSFRVRAILPGDDALIVSRFETMYGNLAIPEEIACWPITDRRARWSYRFVNYFNTLRNKVRS